MCSSEPVDGTAGIARSRGGSYGLRSRPEKAIDYADVDGLIDTGLIHNHGSVAFLQHSAQHFYPANQDPKFAGMGYDNGYITTRPGTRNVLFNPADADPAVMAAADDSTTLFSTETFSSEAGKDVWPSAEGTGAVALLFGPATTAIQVPVLVIMGGADSLCGPDAAGVSVDCASPTAIRDHESPYYASATKLTACSVLDAGEQVSLHLNRTVQVVDAVLWSNVFVGQRIGGQRLPGFWPLPGCGS